MLLQALQRSSRWTHGTLLSRAFATTSKSSTRSSGKGPFDILFCGSDSFSVASLSAVLRATGGSADAEREQSHTDSVDVWKSVQVLAPRERDVGRKGRERYRRSRRITSNGAGLTSSRAERVC